LPTMSQYTIFKSKGVIRRIVEEKSKFLVSFPTHDGYFHVEDQTLRDTIRKAHAERREISFSFDPTLRILSVD